MSSFLFANCLMSDNDSCLPNKAGGDESKVLTQSELMITAKNIKDECDQPKYIKSLKEQMEPSKDKSIVKTTVSDFKSTKTSLRTRKGYSDTQASSQNLKSLIFSLRN